MKQVGYRRFHLAIISFFKGPNGSFSKGYHQHVRIYVILGQITKTKKKKKKKKKRKKEKKGEKKGGKGGLKEKKGRGAGWGCFQTKTCYQKLVYTL